MGPWAHGAGVGAAAPRHTSLWRAQRKLQGSSTSLAEHLRPGRKACAVVRSAFVGSRRPSRVSLGSLGPVSLLAAARPRRGDAFFGSLSSLAIPTWAVCCAPVLYAHAWPCTFPLGHPRSACAVEVIYIYVRRGPQPPTSNVKGDGSAWLGHCLSPYLGRHRRQYLCP